MFLENSDDDGDNLIPYSRPQKREKKETDGDHVDVPKSNRKEEKKKKVPSMFISKEEKARIAAEEKLRKEQEEELERQLKAKKEAEERERRIQEEILKTKQENDSMLFLGKKTEGPAVANSFFAVRTSNKPSAQTATTTQKPVLDLTGKDTLQDMTNVLPPFHYGLPSCESFASRELSVNSRPKYGYILEDLESKSLCQELSNFELHHQFLSLWLRYVTEGSSSKPSNQIVEPVDVDQIEEAKPVIDSLSSGPFPGSVEAMSLWLKDWKFRRISNVKVSKKRKVSKKKYNDSDDEFSSASENEAVDEQEIKNVYILIGPSGTGKTQTVYHSAKSQGMSVIEINTSQARSGAMIKKLISEAAQSHRVKTKIDAPNPRECISLLDSKDVAEPVEVEESEQDSTGISVILFDEVGQYLIYSSLSCLTSYVDVFRLILSSMKMLACILRLLS
jgi:hypothetical protein